jgi:hypothetical protein
MSEYLNNIRYKRVTTLDGSESLYLDDATSDIPKKILMSTFIGTLTTIPDDTVYILNGGVNNQDEDVPQLIGGLNGVSKNSNTINNG